MPNSRQNLRAQDGTPIVVIDEEYGGEEVRGALRSSTLIIRRKLVPPVWHRFHLWRQLSGTEAIIVPIGQYHFQSPL